MRDTDGKVIGAIGILRDMRAYEKVVRDLQESKAELQEKILDLEKFEEVVVGRELKMIALEKEIENLKRELEKVTRGHYINGRNIYQQSSAVSEEVELEWLRHEYARLLEEKDVLEMRVRQSEHSDALSCIS